MGYNVVVPLIRDEGGGEVLVDRGFVSEKSMIINGDDRRLREGEAVQVSADLYASQAAAANMKFIARPSRPATSP